MCGIVGYVGFRQAPEILMVGAQAELHLCASILNFEIMEYHAEFYTDHYFRLFDGFDRQLDGYVTLSDAPGLGLEINDEEISAHPPYEGGTYQRGIVRGI